MIRQSLIERLKKRIEKYANGREVVLYGCTDEFLNCFQREICLIKHIFTRNEILLKKDPALYFHPTLLEGKRDEYYVVLPIYKDGGSFEKGLLDSFGFIAEQDYCFYREKLIYDNQILNGFHDHFNNEITVKSPGVLLRVFGGGNRIHIAEGIAGSAKLQISIDGCNCRIDIKKGTLYGKLLITAQDDSIFMLGDSYRVNSSKMRLLNGASVVIGSGFTCEEGNLSIHADGYAKVMIGEDNMFSSDIIIQASDGHTIFDVNTGEVINWDKEAHFAGSVRLKDHVWIGKRVMLLGGIRETVIGEGSVVGAGSIVKGNYPNNVCIAGNPARILRKDIAWSRHAITVDSIKDCKGYVKKTEEQDNRI